MNLFDLIIIAVACFFLVKSLIRGATREIFSLLAILVGGFLSFRYYSELVYFFQPYLKPFVAPIWAQNLLAFVAFFVIVYLLVNITGWLLSKLLKTVRLSFLDKVAGVFVGAAKAYVVVCCIIILLMLLPNGSKFLIDSALSSYSFPFVKVLSKVLPIPLKERLEEKTKALNKK